MSDNLFATQEESTTQSTAPQEQTTPQGEESKPAQTTTVSDPYADLLRGITTEDGRQKYGDVNTALNSIPHAQTHISELTRKNAELQEELNKRQGMEQVLDRINSTKQTNTEQPSVNSLSEAQVMELLNSALTQKEAASLAQANEAAVTDGLVKKFGDREKATAMIKAKAEELGVGFDFMRSLAQKSPKAVLSYFNTAPSNNPSPTTPGINTASLPNTSGEPNRLEEAKAKLFGQRDPLVESWRAAAPKT